VMGAPAPAKRYYFAEGTTRNVPGNGEFEEWLTLQNANAGPITIDATYQLGEGQGDNARSCDVAAGTKQTVYVNEQAGPGLQLSAQVVSDKPVVAERPMYFNYGGTWTGGHDVLGRPF